MQHKLKLLISIRIIHLMSFFFLFTAILLNCVINLRLTLFRLFSNFPSSFDTVNYIPINDAPLPVMAGRPLRGINHIFRYSIALIILALGLLVCPIISDIIANFANIIGVSMLKLLDDAPVFA